MHLHDQTYRICKQSKECCLAPTFWPKLILWRKVDKLVHSGFSRISNTIHTFEDASYQNKPHFHIKRWSRKKTHFITSFQKGVITTLFTRKCKMEAGWAKHRGTGLDYITSCYCLLKRKRRCVGDSEHVLFFIRLPQVTHRVMYFQICTR